MGGNSNFDLSPRSAAPDANGTPDANPPKSMLYPTATTVNTARHRKSSGPRAKFGSTRLFKPLRGSQTAHVPVQPSAITSLPAPRRWPGGSGAPGSGRRARGRWPARPEPPAAPRAPPPRGCRRRRSRSGGRARRRPILGRPEEVDVVPRRRFSHRGSILPPPRVAPVGGLDTALPRRPVAAHSSSNGAARGRSPTCRAHPLAQKSGGCDPVATSTAAP
jgi:hypothetical protein